MTSRLLRGHSNLHLPNLPGLLPLPIVMDTEPSNQIRASKNISSSHSLPTVVIAMLMATLTVRILVPLSRMLRTLASRDSIPALLERASKVILLRLW
ncbi:unnamed protein product [Protopolystoma xenopodis]|uniref:Uncharacterized protein n=1 Tax=Protopolystoma xenopodis TaxID=117903 RepID=A0A448XFJ0_9PLAT|nr:unnamed protein product [Protopolystoma xenopodis]